MAYRRLGRDSGMPLVMHMHFRGNMDFWDPSLINALAKSRSIILFDNAGVGRSEGEISRLGNPHNLTYERSLDSND
jgi:pimeloyl-ACP methyl ester carboxylesterase